MAENGRRGDEGTNGFEIEGRLAKAGAAKKVSDFPTTSSVTEAYYYLVVGFCLLLARGTTY